MASGAVIHGAFNFKIESVFTLNVRRQSILLGCSGKVYSETPLKRTPLGLVFVRYYREVSRGEVARARLRANILRPEIE